MRAIVMRGHGGPERVRAPRSRLKDRAVARVALLAVSFALAGGLGVGCRGGAPTEKRVEAPHLPPVDRYALALEGGGPAAISAHVPRGGAPPGRGILVLHAAMGRTPGVLAYADELAAHGYGVYALDLFGGKVAADPKEGRALRDAANLDTVRIQALIAAAYAQLAEDPRILATKRFLLGWSYGGAWATNVAASLPGLSGLVAIYGEAFSEKPGLIRHGRFPILLIGGSEDTEPTAAGLRALAEERKAAAGGVAGGAEATEVVIVRGAHGFMEPRNPAYAPDAAREAMGAVVRFVDAAR